MEYQWVIGAFTGDRGKSVKAHADAGLGYFIQQESGAGQGYTVHAAFRRANDSSLPDHLGICNPYQVDKLEKLYSARHGNVSARQ